MILTTAIVQLGLTMQESRLGLLTYPTAPHSGISNESWNLTKSVYRMASVTKRSATYCKDHGQLTH